MVLSASAVISRLSEWSNTQAKMPDSLSREPGCTAAWMRWKLYPVLQSHRWMVPLSAVRGLKTASSDAQASTMKLRGLITDTSWHQDAVGVHGERVDDGVVTRQVLDEVAIWEHPLFDVVGRTRSKSVPEEATTALWILVAEAKSALCTLIVCRNVEADCKSCVSLSWPSVYWSKGWSHLLSGVQHDTSDRLLVVCQSRSGFAGDQIPQPDGWIVAACEEGNDPTISLWGATIRSFGHTETPKLPVMTCGSAAWHRTVATVLVWPVSVCALAFVLMSHTCTRRSDQTDWVTFTKQTKTNEPEVRPHPGCGVSAAGHQHIYSWMQIYIIHSAEVAVVVPDDLTQRDETRNSEF